MSQVREDHIGATMNLALPVRRLRLQPDLGSTFAASDFFWSRSPLAFT